ncbi:hypothetical protein MNBD_GAMMA06-1842 [hydrothermal vent metagenome]|uniref:MPN domain-containing protein n=1 Tax=hydrothermal vent metagenome TaxID=652676 RepID=A0A3B0WCH5_9ZZZZ
MPTKNSLYLPRPLINKLLAHAQKNPDIEVCGLIGNNVENRKRYYPIDNVSKNPDCHFLMDAPQQIKTMKKMREEQQELFAIVHSHPKAKAEPSQQDIESNNYKNTFFIIISLNTEGVLEMRAYIQQQNNMQEVDLILETT